MSELARIKRMLSVEAGRATITISNPRGDHATFKVKHAKGKYAGRTFVEIQDESAQYGWRSVGEALNECRTFRAYGGCSDALAYAIRLVLDALAGASDLDTIKGGPYAVQAADTCGACGRQLTHPDSIPLGLGPECAGRQGVEHHYNSAHVRTRG